MLDTGLFLWVLLSGSVFAAARFGRKFEEILPMTCMGIVLVLFLFGAVGLLSAGVYAVLLAAVCFWACGLWRVVKGGGKQLVKNMLTPAFAVFCGMFLMLMLGDYGMLSTGWDDFSHWQLCVRKMVELGDFAANPASGIYYQSYPPAMALFQYFFEKLHYLLDGEAVFSEWRLFLAYQVLMIAPAMPFFRGLSLPKAVLAGVCLFVLPLLFIGETYTLLYIDSFVGMLAGCGLLAVLLKDRGGLHTAYVAMLCAVLTLAKDVGLYFACFIGVIFFLNRLLTRGPDKDLRKAGIALLPLISALGAKLAWKGILLKLGSKMVFSEPIDLIEYTKMFFFRTGGYYRQDCVEAFKRMFFSREFRLSGIGVLVSYFALTLVFAIALYALCGKLMKTQPERAKAIRAAGILIFAQLIVYVYCLGATYAYRFTVDEALDLAAYNRYMNIAYISVFLPLFFGGFLLLSRRENSLPLLILCAVLLVCCPMDAVHSFLNRDDVADSYVRREPLDELAEAIRDNCAEDARVYFVSQGSDGRDQVIVQFGAEPVAVNSALGHSLDPAEVSAERWQSTLLESYDYVALCQLDDEFAASYGCLFEEVPTDHTLYRLDRQSGLLTPIE
ncbi:MAG: hypothetical protein Q4F81_00270 [Eubacteriales bacterium]|nr:hypothetical protein [Eubacteriales bacterium]